MNKTPRRDAQNFLVFLTFVIGLMLIAAIANADEESRQKQISEIRRVCELESYHKKLSVEAGKKARTETDRVSHWMTEERLHNKQGTYYMMRCIEETKKLN